MAALGDVWSQARRKLILTDALMKRGAEERAARIEGDDQQDTPE